MTLSMRRSEAFAGPPAIVLFDTDNTLYAYDPAHAAALDATRAKANRMLNLSGAEFDEAYREARRRVKERLEGTASAHSRLLYFQRMLEILGLRTQTLLALDFEQTYWRTFLSTARLFPEVKEFLDDLRLADITTVVVTDLTAQIQFRKIVYWGLDHYFDYMVTSEEAGFDKPNAAPFLLSLAKLEPNTGPYWMIGDHAVNDIQGARAAIGAATLQKRHKGVEVLSGDGGPDLVFDHFAELRPLLRDLFADRDAP